MWANEPWVWRKKGYRCEHFLAGWIVRTWYKIQKLKFKNNNSDRYTVIVIHKSILCKSKRKKQKMAWIFYLFSFKSTFKAIGVILESFLALEEIPIILPMNVTANYISISHYTQSEWISNSTFTHPKIVLGDFNTICQERKYYRKEYGVER